MMRETLRESHNLQDEAGGGGSGQSDAVPQAVAPVISLEKTDVQFWLQVGQVVLLFLIWREMMRQGGN